MKAIETQIELDQLADQLAGLTYEVNPYGLRMANPIGGGIPEWAQQGALAAALTELVSLTGRTPVHLMVNILPAGVVIPIHVDRVDAGDHGERWHLPVVTNTLAYWWDEVDDLNVHLPLGHWSGPMPNRKRHRVGNIGETDRTHLIVDLGGKAA